MSDQHDAPRAIRAGKTRALEGIADYCRDDRGRTGQGIQPRDRATVFDVCPVLGMRSIVLVM